MSILVLNAGSSTLKFAVFDDDAIDELCHGVVDWKGREHTATLKLKTASSNDDVVSDAEVPTYGDAVALICHTLEQHGWHDAIQALGHRVVHGGMEFRAPVVIDDSVVARLQGLSKLAPLHQPNALATLEATRLALPNAKQVAVFDTAYFADLPQQAVVYPVPYQWYEQFGIRRYGFHGISHSYCAKRAEQMLGRVDNPALRLIVCHLGGGSSATAIVGGRPVQTTMGFTPLDGLMMGTRSGSIDPGIMIHMMREHGFDADRFEEALNRQAGLLGVSGVSSDFRTIEMAAQNSEHNENDQAKLAIEMFADRVRSTIGGMAVSMGGVDGLVFTAGIGENSASLRGLVCQGLECLGLQLDAQQNATVHLDSDIAATDSTARILVIRTREEQMVARETIGLLKPTGNLKFS